MTLQNISGRRQFSLSRLQPTTQVLIMLAFTLVLVGLIALAGYLLPGAVTGAATLP